MKTAWLFGGSTKKFGKDVTNGVDKVISFGRHNVDYSNIEGFLLEIEKNSQLYPIPDIIIFNISNNGHILNPTKTKTDISEIHQLTAIIQSTFYFELRLTEWFFQNFDNKKILWLTSMQPYCFEYNGENDEGDLILYRMTRALEHQIIFQQNILKHNIDKNNFIMGTCVGNNAPGISNYLNKLIIEDKLKPGVFGLHNDSPTTEIVTVLRLGQDKLS